MHVHCSVTAFLSLCFTLQELGMACMHADPDERPSFTQIIATLEELSDLAAEDPMEMVSEGYPMHIL